MEGWISCLTQCRSLLRKMAQWFEKMCVDLGSDGLVNESNGYNDATMIFVSSDDPFQTLECARFYSDQFSGFWKGMWFGLVTVGEALSHRFYLGVINRGRRPAERKHAHHARNAEDMMSFPKIDAGKDIAGKNRSFNQNPAIFPVALRGQEWEKGFD